MGTGDLPITHCPKSFGAPGVVAEWLKAAVLKTAKGATPS